MDEVTSLKDILNLGTVGAALVYFHAFVRPMLLHFLALQRDLLRYVAFTAGKIDPPENMPSLSHALPLPPINGKLAGALIAALLLAGCVGARVAQSARSFAEDLPRVRALSEPAAGVGSASYARAWDSLTEHAQELERLAND